MPVLTNTLLGWLESIAGLDSSWSFNDGPYIPDMPDKLVTATALDGAGFVVEEGSLDQPFFQIRVRGAQDDRDGTERAAFAIDSAIGAQRYPQRFAGTQINLVARRGGAPATLGPPEADSMRYEYVCTYRVVGAN